MLAGDYRVAPRRPSADGQMNARSLSLGIGKSVVIDLPRDIKDVLVADPKIANAVIRSAQRAYIIGAAVGQTNIVFFDSAGQQIAAYDIAVKRDLNGARAALKQIMPNAEIQIDGLGDGVVLSGTASSPIEAQQAGDLAARLAGGADKVVNSIMVRGRDQVMLKVTVAEVARNIIKQLGIDLSGSLNYGTSVVNFNNANPFTAYGRALVANNSITGAFGRHAVGDGHHPRDGKRRRGAHAGRTEPDRDLGRIRDLHRRRRIPDSRRLFLRPGHPCLYHPDQLQEVRHLAQLHARGADRGPHQPARDDRSLGTVQRQLADAVAGGTVDRTLTIPSIRTRRAETTLEIPSGGSMAMAGLIPEQTKQAINGLPGLAQLPVLGTLFRSRDFVNNQTELMVLVTPYVVRAVAQKDLSRPDDGFSNATDPQADLLGSINRIYGVPGRVEPARNYRGTYGFITD